MSMRMSRPFAPLCFCLSLLASDAFSQATPSHLDSVRLRADSLFAAKKFAAAAHLMERVVAARSADGESWFRLGNARYRAALYAPAAEAFEQAAERSYRETASLYNAGSSLALAGNRERALAMVLKALDAGFSNKYLLLTDSDLDVLRDDVRWHQRLSRFFGTAGYSELSQPVARIRNIGLDSVPMRDGVNLATEVVLPQGGGRFPTVLVRTPYGRGWQVFNRAHWAARGYALVVQDVRGRGNSEGAWEPWLNERQDGEATVEWIRAQPWSDGKVGMIGASYEAQTQWLTATAEGSRLDAMISLVSGTDPFLDTPYDHGILKLGLLDWVYSTTHPEAKSKERDSELLRTLPISALDDAYFGEDLPIWNDWVRRGTAADWRRATILDRIPLLKTPVLHVSGLWDVESIGTATNWEAMKQAELSKRWLIFGPWGHQNFVDPVDSRRGDVDYGPNSLLPFTALWVRFFDQWLKDRDVGWKDQPRARMFVTGSNEWLELDDFPPAAHGTLLLYPARGERTGADHVLAFAAPDGPSDRVSYRYDPAASLLMSNSTFSETTIYDDHDDPNRGIRFVTSSLDRSVVVTGQPELEIQFTTNVPETDFFALLLDVDEAGTARAVGQPAKIRTAFLNGWDSREKIEAGKLQRANIRMFPVAHNFAAGHRIGLVIRSDWFPRFARNLNTSEDPYHATRMLVATQSVHLGGTAPTVLRLIVPQ